MESNGKHVTLEGKKVSARHGPIYWGEPGTNGQHSFYQLIHQGTQAHPVRLHRLLQAAQSARPAPRHSACQCLRADRGAGLRQDSGASRGGRHPEWLVPHRVFEGNRPSNTILAERLTPETLGNWWRSTNTPYLRRAQSGISIRSTSGASSWERSSRSASSLNWRAKQNRSSRTTVPPTT